MARVQKLALNIKLISDGSQAPSPLSCEMTFPISSNVRCNQSINCAFEMPDLVCGAVVPRLQHTGTKQFHLREDTPNTQHIRRTATCGPYCKVTVLKVPFPLMTSGNSVVTGVVGNLRWIVMECAPAIEYRWRACRTKAMYDHGSIMEA